MAIKFKVKAKDEVPAELQSLYGYAQQQQMNLLPYAASFMEIEGQLQLLYEHLREREARTK